MSVAISENIREEFSKPPPKKKWLQNYIGKDSPDSTQQLTLSKDVIGGVVQGVLDQFNNYLDHDTGEKEDTPEISSPAEEEKLSQTDIAPVVQSVISQFLNGSLADSGFRRSRKRSHKNINSRSKDKSGSSYSSSASNIRKIPVIQYKGLQSEKSDKPSIKVRKLEALISTKNQTKQMFSNQLKHPEISKKEESTEALNLSCPKINTKVTFANEDRCYSIDSVKSFQESKSLKMFSLDYSRIHENLQLIVADGESPLEEEEAPLNLVNKAPNRPPSDPVFLLRESLGSNQTTFEKYSPKLKNQSEFSSLTSSFPPCPPPKPLELITGTKRQRNVFPAADINLVPSTEPSPSFELPRPRPVRPADCTPSPHLLQDLISARPLKSKVSLIDAVKSTPSPSPSTIPEPPCAFSVPESESRPGGSKQSTREVHNRLEKNRRAHLKSCFNELAFECDLDPAKASNLLVIRTAYKSIMALRREEREQERSLASLVQDKIRRQARLNELRREFAGLYPEPDSD